MPAGQLDLSLDPKTCGRSLIARSFPWIAMGARLGRRGTSIVAADYRPAGDGQGSERLRVELTQAGRQQALF